MSATPAMRIPAVLPFRGPIPRHRGPFATGMIIPGAGLGFGGGCFFNGFTNVCGPGFGFFGQFGGPCPRRFGVVNCGFGFGLGYGYGYGLGYGWNVLSAFPVNDSYSPDNSGYMDIYGGYIGEMGGTTPPSADAGTANPDEVGPAATPAVPAQIILKDGSAYAVKAYWVSNGELYYQPVTGGLNHVPLEQLDLAATVDANSRNGIAFTLTDRPPQN